MNQRHSKQGSAFVAARQFLVTLASSILCITGCTSTVKKAPGNSDWIEAQNRLTSADLHRVKILILSPNGKTAGGGVWLGNAKVLTANHLFLSYKPTDKILVQIGGSVLEASLVSRGDLDYKDLALLTIDNSAISEKIKSLQGPEICDKRESIGASLEVVAFDQSYHTKASPDQAVSYKNETWSRGTTTAFSHGVSGSPVYDEESGCLAGIVSRFDDFINLSGPIDEISDRKKCITATKQLNQGPWGITCGTLMQTLFSTSDDISEFLQQAKTTQSAAGQLNNKSL